MVVNLPPRQQLTQLLGSDDFFVGEYYGEGFLGRMQAWIFRSRIRTVMDLLRQRQPRLRRILDVGCGPMFVSYPLTNDFTCQYVGVDTLPLDRLKKYRDAMRNGGPRAIEGVRASAHSLPFRDSVFDLALGLDVLEHLGEAEKSVMEIYRVTVTCGLVVISVPLENLFQRLSRIGFIFMEVSGNRFRQGKKCITVTRTPRYHYGGDVKSYKSMVKVLRRFFSPLRTPYTPIGVHNALNVNAIHSFRKEGSIECGNNAQSSNP